MEILILTKAPSLMFGKALNTPPFFEYVVGT